MYIRFVRHPASFLKKPPRETVLALVLFIFLVSVPCVSITRYANRLITEKIRFGNENFLQAASSSLDSAVRSATNQVSVLVQTNSADYYALLNAPSITGSDVTMASYHLYNALRGCQFDPAYFNDLFLYFRNPGLVLTSSGSYDAETYFQKKHIFSNYPSDYFDSLMDMPFMSKVCPSTLLQTRNVHGETNVLYDSVIPIVIHPTGSSGTDALLVLLINEDTLTETFNSFNPARSCFLYLMDTLSGNILNQTSAQISLTELSALEYSGSSGNMTRKISSEKCRILWENSSVSQLRYICAEPELLITKQLHSFLFFTFLTTFAAVALLMLLYHFITQRLRNNFASIFHRMKQVSGSTESVPPPQGIGFSSLKDAVELLCTHYESSQPHLILSFLTRLLQDIAEEEEIAEFCDSFGAIKPDDYFCILVLRVNFPTVGNLSPGDASTRAAVLNTLQQRLTEFGYVIPLHDRRDHVLFLTASSARKLQTILNQLAGIWEEIVSSLPEFVCGQSVLFHDIHETYRNYHQVLNVLEYHGIRMPMQIYRIEDMTTAADCRLLPEDKEKIQSLARHTPDACPTCVEKLLAGYKQHNVSFHQYKTTILELLFLLQQILYEAEIPLSAIFHNEEGDLISGAENLVSSRCLDALCLEGYRQFSCLAPGIHESLDQAKQTLLNYIDEHLADINLTVLSEITGMNQNYLSQYFKKHFGTTFLDYVTRKKMERAKDMLMNSSLTCKAIGESLGYHDSNVFIRTFKKLESITPNEYRKIKKRQLTEN